MACAKPIVLANTGEVVDLVEDNNVGRCVLPGNIEAFSNAILDLYHDRELCRQCGENGFKLAKGRFSIANLARRLEEVFQ